MAHNTATILLVTLSLAAFSSLAESNSCQCNLRRAGFGGRVCSDGTAPSNAPDAQEYRRHSERGLYGDCLPEVEANTFRCFRWKTRACSDVADLCEYRPTRSKFNGNIMSSSQSAQLFSPNHRNGKFGRHFFCVYNVSLSCSSNSVIVQSTATTNWPRQQNTDCHETNTCENYVAFYTGRNTNHITRQFYGQQSYTTTLESSSFLAVLWTNREPNSGSFEFHATCNTNQLQPTALASEEEGSGNNILTQEA